MTDDLEPRLEELLAERGRVESNAVDRALGTIDALPERRLARRSMGYAAAAVVTLAVVGIAMVVLFPGPTDVATPSPSPSIPSLAPSSSTAVVTPSPTPTMQPRPVWAMNLSDHLECDGPPATGTGMDVPEVPAWFDLAPTPDGALQLILTPFQSLPASGYLPVLVDGHWALHRYLVDGRPKVHIVSHDEFPDAPNEGWSVVGVRTCDPSEYADADFGPQASTIWSDAAGDPVRTDRITSHAWPAHCFNKRAVLLSFFDPDYTQYVRDPSGEFAQMTVVPYAADARLPEDAVDTGLHTDDWHLFTIPSGRAVFMRTARGTYEMWPRASQPIGCM